MQVRYNYPGSALRKALTGNKLTNGFWSVWGVWSFDAPLVYTQVFRGYR